MLKNKMLLTVVCLFALYGLIVLIRKISSDSDKNLNYFFSEQYRHTKGCPCGKIGSVCKSCKNNVENYAPS